MPKKSFSTELTQTAPTPTAEAYITQDDTQENKSKRLNLLLRPTLHRDLGKLSAMERISTNELINRVLTEYAEQNADKIQKYDEIFGEQITF